MLRLQYRQILKLTYNTCDTNKVKVKVVPYTFVHMGVVVGEDTNPEPLAGEVGRPVPFLAH